MTTTLFNTTATTNNTRELPGTAQLTALASSCASEVILKLNANIETYRDRVDASASDNRAMDALLDELLEYGDQADFLTDLDEAIVSSMLKSQQSKRSRTKSKQMTDANYVTLMTAAIAERIIRDKCGIAKSAGRVGRAAGTIGYTAEQLEALAADQDALRKEIRNVQSKKSIMKSKAGFDTQSERWLALCDAEEQLRGLRIGGRQSVVEVDRTKTVIRELLKDADLSKMKADAMRSVLQDIMQEVFAD